MKKLILLNDVSSLSMQFHVNAQDAVFPHFDHLGESRSKHAGLGVDVSMLASSNMNSNRADSFDYSDMLSTQSRGKHMFTASVQLEIMELLEEWEEPELQGVDEEVSRKIHQSAIVPASPSFSFCAVNYRGDNSSIPPSPRIYKGRISFLSSIRRCSNARRLCSIGTDSV
jgi:hypothetical protein